MWGRLVEVVPNFSEGRRKEVVDDIVSHILSVPNVILLDVEMDPDHNRSVVTFIAPPEEAIEASFRGVKRALELIDLNYHRGEHPRIGACDVLPFIPLYGLSMEECILLAKRVGKRIAEELNIPVYLYGEAATTQERKDLANIRKGEFEGLKEAIKTDPKRKPDFGPSEVHPTFGAIAVGARKILIAYNVNLNTSDLRIAQEIAKQLRGKSGGFINVKALGFMLHEKGIAQVSMNLTDFEKTPIHLVFENVKLLAERYGVGVLNSEIVGLIPLKALVDTLKFYLRLDNFRDDQIIEARIEKKSPSLQDYILSLSSSDAVPGGGSASSLSLSQAYALLQMVALITLKSKKYAENHKYIEPILDEIAKRLRESYSLIEKDAEAFESVRKARKLRDEKLFQEALKGAVAPPLRIMELSRETESYIQILLEKGHEDAKSDVGVSFYQADSALNGAFLNVLINLLGIEDKSFVEEVSEKAKKIREDWLKFKNWVENLILRYFLT